VKLCKHYGSFNRYEDLVAEVSARYDVFSIFKVGKKYNTTFSTFDVGDEF
jgi:hypothetical protein